MWFISKYYNEHLEIKDDISLPECFPENNHNKYHLQDFMILNVTTDNYMNLIELSDFLMVYDIDPLVDKIVECFGYYIIHEFSNQYKYNSGRIKPHTEETLRDAIKLYCDDQDKCYELYGYSAYWDVSNVTNMNYMFYGTQFNGDISKWNVSKVKYMTNTFDKSKFKGDISQWNTSSITNTNYTFILW